MSDIKSVPILSCLPECMRPDGGEACKGFVNAAMRVQEQQARIEALENTADRYSDNGHFPDCAVNEWTTADCTCGLAELEALLEGEQDGG